MPKTMMDGVGKFSRHYPMNVAIVTTRTENDQDAMAAAWHSTVSFNPPLYGVSIASKRHTHDLILEGKKFGICFIPKEKGEISAQTGGVSGRDVDKFERFGLALEEESGLDLPILKDAYAAYECRLHSHHELGDHVWFVGEVLFTHFDEEVFDERQMIRLEKVTPTLYLGFDHYLFPTEHEVKHLERAKLDE